MSTITIMNRNIPSLSSVVLDSGSGMCKAGMSNMMFPQSEFPTVVGTLRYSGQPLVCNDIDYRDRFVGHEAICKRSLLSLRYPIEHGIVTDWDDMEKIWHHTFYDELRTAPEEHPCLLTEAPLNPKQNREKMTQIMFETFNVPAFYVSIQAVLSLYAQGFDSGIVLDSGHGVTHVVPIYKFYKMPHAILRMDLAGGDLNEYLLTLLNEQGRCSDLQTRKALPILSSIKESLCYVAEDYLSEMDSAPNNAFLSRGYELPDGHFITLETERFRCPELLFQPSPIGKELDGIHEMIYRSIRKCDIDIRRDLFKNIIISGGNTLFPGLKERLTKEVKALVPPGVKVEVAALEERKHSVWIGGAIQSDMLTTNNEWISKAEYEEYGPAVVHRYCF